MTEHHIYTDGAAPNNGNCIQGGVGVAIYDKEHHLIGTCKDTVRLFGGTTTNVRCEMLALIAGLERSSGNDIIYTDNDMLVKGYNQWLDGLMAGKLGAGGKARELLRTLTYGSALMNSVNSDRQQV
ncbi:RNase H family protein [Vibrio albus]|uniref:RNase H family protein n=1 Tax=Vibrio albus TaxID=2200953 RepID=UPI001FE9A66C|nr:RNase H family protein [Vibrio albus]